LLASAAGQPLAAVLSPGRITDLQAGLSKIAWLEQ